MKDRFHISYNYESLGLIELFTTFIPFKAKKRLIQWATLKKDVIDKIVVQDNDFSLEMTVYFKVPGLMSFQAHGSSFAELWDEAMRAVVEFENMRNIEELCIWLDSKK